jgi:hypothetical protein
MTVSPYSFRRVEEVLRTRCSCLKPELEVLTPVWITFRFIFPILVGLTLTLVKINAQSFIII